MRKGLNLMRLGKKRATVLCSMALAALASSAIARPVHDHHAARTAEPAMAPPASDWAGQHSFLASQAPDGNTAPNRRHTHRSLARARAAAPSHSNSAYGGHTSNPLVAEARKYIGTNPTGRSSLWCGAFMDMVLKRTGHIGGGNLALGYSHYGHRISGPQVGAIAVMGRHGGGHVGVVSGIDANGNPIIVSGNHNHTVAESVYPRSRISAYVMPGG
jgi:uncharacterized protein (TIGR02594 family)